MQLLNPPVSRCRLQHTPVSKICQNPKKSGLFVGQIFLTLNFCLGLYSSSLGSAMVSTDWTTSLASGGSSHQRYDIFCCFLTKNSCPTPENEKPVFYICIVFLVLSRFATQMCDFEFAFSRPEKQYANSKQIKKGHSITPSHTPPLIQQSRLPFVQILRGPHQ